MDLPGFWSGSYADVRKDMRVTRNIHGPKTQPRRRTRGQAA